MINFNVKEEEGKASTKGNSPGTDREQNQSTAKFLYDIAKLAFGAAITAGCLKGEISSIFISLLFAVMVALTALNLERKGNDR